MNDTQKFCVNCGSQIRPLKSDQDQSVTHKQPSEQPVGNVRYTQNPSGQYQPPNRHAYLENVSIPKRNYWKYASAFIGSIILSFVIFGGFIFYIFSSPNSNAFINFMDSGGFYLLLITPLIALTGSLIYLYYFYKSAEDYQKLHFKTHNPYPEPHNPALLLLFFFIFSPLAYFMKHDQLYKHLTEEHGRNDNLPFSGIVVLLVIFLPVIALFFGFFLMIFAGFDFGFFFMIFYGTGIFSPIFLLYAESKWQNSLNHHIDFHDAGEPTFS